MPQNGFVAATLAAVGFALSIAASAASAASAAADAPPARKLPTKVTFHKSPSEESPAQREKRLKRECKGRPNAGACLGFAAR